MSRDQSTSLRSPEVRMDEGSPSPPRGWEPRRKKHAGRGQEACPLPKVYRRRLWHTRLNAVLALQGHQL